MEELAGALGFEPRYQAPKACVLPLDDAPEVYSLGTLLLRGNWLWNSRLVTVRAINT